MATKKATTTKKAATKKELKVGTVFTTDSLARAISAGSADAEGKPKYSITEANDIVNLVKESIKAAVKEGQKVQLTGFLSITPAYREEREGNNVFTGEKMTIPASVTLNVKAGKALKDVARELDDDIVEAIKAANAK